MALTPREIDAEIARHISAVDQLRSLAREMAQPDNAREALRLQIIRELLVLADTVLRAWQLDREGSL